MTGTTTTTKAPKKEAYFAPFCGLCGERTPSLEPNAIACPYCGGDLVPQHMDHVAPESRKEAWTAALLSLFIPGAGQVYNGRFFRGVLVFATCWLIVPWVFGVIDAYGTARRAELAFTAARALSS